MPFITINFKFSCIFNYILLVVKLMVFESESELIYWFINNNGFIILFYNKAFNIIIESLNIHYKSIIFYEEIKYCFKF